MRRIALTVSCLLTVWAAGAAAQVTSQEPIQRGLTATEADVYCAGMITNADVPYDMYVISGVEADPQTVFSQGNYIYLNKGSAGGVKIGDEFMVLRPEKDFLHVQAFDGEHRIANGMGKQWADVGRVRVVVVQPNVAIARVTYSCTFVQRGDTVLPAVNFPTPAFKPLRDLDRFAPPSGKSAGRVVKAKLHSMTGERGGVLYVNLTDVKAGDYIRFYRPSAPQMHAIYQVGGMTDHVFGLGKTPSHYGSGDVPREVLGEGVVLRTTPTSASVLVFNMLREIYLGDFAEIE